MKPRASSVTLALLVDVALVLAFVLAGRGSHDEGFTLAGTATTAWPFLVGLLVGWLAFRVWRSPRRVIWSGLGLWVATVAVGMMLRMVSGQGTAASFVIVATLVLAVFLLGWRAIAALLVRSRRPASV